MPMEINHLRLVNSFFVNEIKRERRRAVDQLDVLARELARGLEAYRSCAEQHDSSQVLESLAAIWQPDEWLRQLEQTLTNTLRTKEEGLLAATAAARDALDETCTILRAHNRDVVGQLASTKGTSKASAWGQIYLAWLEKRLSLRLTQVRVAATLTSAMARRWHGSLSELARQLGKSAAYLSGLRRGQAALLTTMVAQQLDRHLYPGEGSTPFMSVLSRHMALGELMKQEEALIKAAIPPQDPSWLDSLPEPALAALRHTWERDRDGLYRCLELLRSPEMLELALRLGKTSPTARRAILQLLKEMYPQA